MKQKIDKQSEEYLFRKLKTVTYLLGTLTAITMLIGLRIVIMTDYSILNLLGITVVIGIVLAIYSAYLAILSVKSKTTSY